MGSKQVILPREACFLVLTTASTGSSCERPARSESSVSEEANGIGGGDGGDGGGDGYRGDDGGDDGGDDHGDSGPESTPAGNPSTTLLRFVKNSVIPVKCMQLKRSISKCPSITVLLCSDYIIILEENTGLSN